MRFRPIALAVCASACGNVASPAATDGAIADRPDSNAATTLKGHVDQTAPVMFGGGPKGFCLYSITLQQLDLALTVEPSGQVGAGQVRDLNVEMVLPKTPPCPYGPAPPTIADYTLDSAKPGPGGMTLVFQAASSNQPIVTLVGTLAGGSTPSVTLTFHRTDQPADPVLDWAVVATLPMTPQ